jgi:bifunctional DNase/RNase
VHSSSRSTRARILALAIVPAVALVLACARSDADETLRAVYVAGVSLDPATASPVMQLVEDGEPGRVLHIWIGEFEAQSIESAIERVPIVRPNSHDLLTDVLTRVEGHVRRTLVTELRDGTYYAVIEVDLHGRELRIDARPSDAIALALRTGAPVLVRESLFDRAIEIPDDESALEIDVRTPARIFRDTPRL